jgi:hypothetical protein
MSDATPKDGRAVPIADAELRELLGRARAHDDSQLVRLVTSYVTLRRVMADVIASIETRDGGAAVARNPLLFRARELSGGMDRLARQRSAQRPP